MPADWLEMSTVVTQALAEPAEAVLLEAGAVSVTLRDAADRPVLEPAPGETPLWPTLQITGLFATDADPLALLAVLQAGLPGAEWRPSKLSGRVWEREWMRDFGPMRFGHRLAVIPSGHEPPAGTVAVRLDPGLAFGTGTHPTTALCLEWLDELSLPGKEDIAPLIGARLIDYGCGSGILAIAAVKLGAESVLAVDRDPQALRATAANAAANGVAAKISTCTPAQLDTVPGAGKADILVANILAGPLESLLPEFARRLPTGGRLALSGILGNQAPALMAAAKPWFRLEAPVAREDWVRISGRRRSAG
jgi:ribosomal protein L11 methyltransferase